MTFDEWFETRFPPVADHMRAIRESYREIALDAWNKSAELQVEHYDQMAELAEYERSVFGMRNRSDW